MKKYKIAFHTFLLLFLLTITGLAGSANLRVVDLVTGNPIQDVLITVTYTNGTIISISTFHTNGDGRAAVFHPGLGGSSCMVITVGYTLSKPGYQFSNPDGLAPCGPFNYDLQILGTTLPPLFSVSAANYQRHLTSDMITASFGENLAATTEFATLPLPTTLAGRHLMVKDAQGAEKVARLLFVSPTQINYIVPSDLANGVATTRLIDESGNQIKFGFIDIASVAAGIFTMDVSGQGVPAAAIVRSSTGFQVWESVARFDKALQRYVPVEIDLGSDPSEVVLLVLFGTGWRQAKLIQNMRVNLSNSISGVDCPVEYVGRQPTIEGLDQINARLPRTLIGKGDVILRVLIDQSRANEVQLKIK